MKKFVICLIFANAGLWFIPEEASTFSTQVRGGINWSGSKSENKDDNKKKGNISVGMDAFIYEGEDWDIFLGVEQGDFSAYQDLGSSGNNIDEITMSGTATSGIFGLRYKFITTKSR